MSGLGRWSGSQGNIPAGRPPHWKETEMSSGPAILRATPVIQLIRMKDVDKDELEQAALDGKGTEYFQGFNLGQLVHSGAVLEARNEGLRILTECLRADRDAYKSIHKGGPYYWLGMAAFVMHDFETALYFMDAAASEDMRHEPPLPDAPGVLFIRLEGDSPNQAAQQMVQVGQARIEGLITAYNQTTGRTVANLSVSEFREVFLRPAATRTHESWKTLATAFISFVIEADARVAQRELVGQTGTMEPFILHLFKGCVLFESLLKQSPAAQSSDPGLATGTIRPVLQHLSGRLGVAEDVGRGTFTLPQVLEDLASADDSITSAVRIAVKTRNTTGHNLAWNVDLSHEAYQQLYERVGIACLHAVSCLYRPAQNGD